ncbi:hypothetical protein AMTRI_Chr11g99020 [Amborella trichopoda]
MHLLQIISLLSSTSYTLEIPLPLIRSPTFNNVLQAPLFSRTHGVGCHDIDDVHMPTWIREHRYESLLSSIGSPRDKPLSAMLSGSHLHQLQAIPAHLATYPDSYGTLNKQTGLSPVGKFSNDTIIGIINTGIWPESESFDDKGMPPVPPRWRGACETGRGINISENNDYDSSRDLLGHGTHTASTAAGSPVCGADYFGYAKGTAVAPMTLLAMYKVGWATDAFGTSATDVLAGMNRAIEDGVDLMSGFSADTLLGQPGNSGPDAYTIYNGAPWITTVGASTLDRGYAASATLRGEGNDTIEVFRTDICSSNLLDPSEVAGKILFFSYSNESAAFTQMDEANRTRAKAMILVTDFRPFFRPNDFYFPAIALGLKDGEIVKNFMTRTVNTTADIKFHITNLDQKLAPQVVYFSSRGPYRITPRLDVVAPEVNVIAAWMPNREAAVTGSDYLVSDYRLLSGTSMSSPHVVGVAALLRVVHAYWSVTAIRSALMTTAYTTDSTHGPILDMTTGVAMDPGLIYDLGVQDYIDFVRIITRRSNYTFTTSNFDVNYPSFMSVLTNVQDSPAVYHAVVEAPIGMNVTVEPQVLSFGPKGSTRAFILRVDVDLRGVKPKTVYLGNYGHLSWVDAKQRHVVRSPIVSAFAP